MRPFALVMIGLYQRFLSPALWHLGARCRFHPSCSEYARQAFSSFNFLRAAYLTGRRFLRCGPWNLGGFDEPRSKDISGHRA